MEVMGTIYIYVFARIVGTKHVKRLGSGVWYMECTNHGSNAYPVEGMKASKQQEIDSGK